MAAGEEIEDDAWNFGFEGDPELNEVDEVLTLGITPEVRTANVCHKLVKATPWAKWTTVPGADAEAAAVVKEVYGTGGTDADGYATIGEEQEQ